MLSVVKMYCTKEFYIIFYFKVCSKLLMKLLACMERKGDYMTQYLFVADDLDDAEYSYIDFKCV